MEEHGPALRLERPSGGAFCGVVREEFLVQTKVSKGSALGVVDRLLASDPRVLDLIFTTISP